MTGARIPPWAAGALIAALIAIACFVDAVVLPTQSLPILYLPALFVAAAFWRPRPIVLLGAAATVIDYFSSLGVPAPMRAVGAAMLFACALLAAEAARRRTEAEESARLADRARRLVVAFQDMVAHDLLTPLSALQLRLFRAQRGQAEAMELDALDRSLRQIGRLVDDLRASAALLGHHFAVVPETHDLAASVREVVRELRPEGERRSIHLDAPAAVIGRWDPDRLRQVVNNLVGNALKHSTGDVDVRVAREADEAILAVRDHGAGIPAAEVERIFQPYERLGVDDRPGLGLGLFISKEIVQAHAGRISVESAPDGATFTVRLPIAGPGQVPPRA